MHIWILNKKKRKSVFFSQTSNAWINYDLLICSLIRLAIMNITIYGEVICHRNGLASFQIWLESEQLFAVKLEPTVKFDGLSFNIQFSSSNAVYLHVCWIFSIKNVSLSFLWYVQCSPMVCVHHFIFEPIPSLNMNIFFLNWLNSCESAVKCIDMLLKSISKCILFSFITFDLTC